MRYVITGGAGFIGSNFIKHLLKEQPDSEVVNIDKFSYAGNPENLKDFENDPRHELVKGDICNPKIVDDAVEGSDMIINFAAESHVDRSIGDPGGFILTDVYGTHVLLEAARKNDCGFVQISTDEVYGSISEGSFFESSTLNPSSPYSASKAGGELVAMAYFRTYGVPVIITRSSNNYGPNQHPEKLIPLFITNAIENKELPVYGDGSQVRDWIFVEDNCRAILKAIDSGKSGEIYNIGAGNEFTNMEITKMILTELKKPQTLIRHVNDRPGHDKRYSIDSSKIISIGWEPKVGLKEGIRKTVKWYLENQAWWGKIKSGEFKDYYKKNYHERHGLKEAK